MDEPSSNTRPEPPATLRQRLLPTCREMSAHSSRALDERPGPLLRAGMSLHLAFCTLCRRYARQLRWIRDAARRTPPAADPDPAADAARRERLRARLRGMDAGTTPRKDAGGETR